MSIQNAFAAATRETKVLPKLNCLGSVAEVQTSGVTSTNLFSQPFRLVDTLGKTSFANLYYRPEWLRSGFNPLSLKAEARGDKLYITYLMNIGGERNEEGDYVSVPTLGGLFGSEANYAFGATALQEIANNTPDDEVAEAVENYLRVFFAENDVQIGYYSMQRYNKGADGSKVIAPNKRQVGGWFWPSEEAHKRNIADANRGRSVMTYEP